MYKLVVVGGKLRGKEFTLNQGENVMGRDPTCGLHADVEGVSKRHLSITVSGDACYVQDLGSSNGTFVNGKIVKRATVKAGDKLTLPDTIMQVVFIKEQKKIVKKTVNRTAEVQEDEFLRPPPMPAHFPSKLLHIFRYKFMPFVHGINQEYEWHALMGIILAVFVFTTIGLTLFPILDSSKRLLINETALRGAHFAEEIGRINARALEQKNLDSVDINFIKLENDVVSHELFDLEGRIVRPIERLNEYVNDPFSVKAREWAAAGANSGSNTFKTLLDDGEIGIAHRIMAVNSNLGISEPVGVIALRFKPQSLVIEATQNSKAFLESLIIAGLLAVLFFGVLYFMTLRPLEELRFQIEEVLRGKQRGIEGGLLMSELAPLKSTVNSLLQRVRDMQAKESGQAVSEEDSGPYLETLRQLLMAAGSGALILDSSKQLQGINAQAEELTAIRFAGSEGVAILDLCREQGFAATMIELCDNSANNSGTAQSANYDLQGRPYKVFGVALMGKDSFAKGFLITFVKEE